MAKLNIERCPETGLCSILKPDGTKVDLMPDEVENLRQAAGKAEAMKRVLSEVDGRFADKLDAAELAQIFAELK
jgi:hypothetical protein